MVTVGKAARRDIPALAVLYEQLTEEASHVDKMAPIFESNTNDAHYHLLAACDENGALLGSAMGILCRDLAKECRPFMLIENVVVLESARRQGAGRALMKELEAIARAHGCGYILLVSGSDRTAAHAFYERMGYPPGRARGFKKDLLYD